MGPLPGVRSKDPDAQREALSGPPAHGCPLGTTTPHPQHVPAPGSEGFRMPRNDCGVRSIHFFVSLSENHDCRHWIRRTLSQPPYVNGRLDD